ncbi:MAG: hypothetical protein LBT59_01010 [Clostridiales bacterium]|jgi:hypothetical protein|nr:hypothetical protein [Clostridiales bacterium]
MIYMMAALYGALGILILAGTVFDIRKNGLVDRMSLALAAFTIISIIALVIVSIKTNSLSSYGLIGIPVVFMSLLRARRQGSAPSKREQGKSK